MWLGSDSIHNVAQMTNCGSHSTPRSFLIIKFNTSTLISGPTVPSLGTDQHRPEHMKLKYAQIQIKS